MKFASMIAAGALSLAALAITAAPASASYVFAGQWEVDNGPNWTSAPPNGPLAYTGQEAAALLFGGSASNYAISTINSNPADINFDAWYSVIGYEGNQGNGGSLLAQNYVSKYLGLYYGPTSGYPAQDPGAAASAYVDDNATGPTFTNFAFRIVGTVPEPATWVMLILGFGMTGAMLRASRKQREITA